MKTTTLFSAGALLGTFVLAVPAPQESTPPLDLESDDFQVLPYQDIQASTVVTTNKGEFTIESRLTDFRGCDGKKDIITEAFADAIKIVNSVGNPHYIIGYPAGQPRTPKGKEVYDYWGPEDNWHSAGAWNIVTGNFKRAQVGGTEGWLGDWWYDRYFQIVCDDPLARCSKEGLAGYQNDPGTKQNDGKYPRINLCPRYFTNLRSLSERIQIIKNGELKPDNPENLRSQGSVLLHELFHTATKNVAARTDAGISNPKAVDHKPLDGSRGNQKAYGAHRAKFLARMKSLEKRQLVFTNVDNFVYYALSRLMMEEFNVPYPEKPPAGWDPNAAVEGEEQELAIDDDENAVMAEFTTEEELLSDEELYASPDAPQPSATENHPPPPPEPTEEVVCYDPGKGSANPASCYIARDAMISHAAAFCDEVGGLDTAKLSKGYAQDTYSGAILQIDSDKKISKDECVTRFGHFIDGCVPNANNPMNWKYGGELHFDGTHYKINVDGGRSCKRQVNEGDAPMQSVAAKCDSFYQFIRDEFWIYGAGFLGDNFGKSLFDQMSSCIGSSVTDWTFDYYESPDNGMEWKAFGHTPIWQKNCFSPVIKGSGGPDVPCNGQG